MDRNILEDMFKHGGWDILDTMSFVFYDAVFKQDFGPINKGDTFGSISVDFDKGILETYDTEGVEVTHTVKFRLCAE
jgi:hypothetical protein